MTSSTRGSVGVIGLGAMGSAMSEHLLASGYQVSGVDIDIERCQAASKSGVEITDLSTIASSVDCLITSMPSFDAAFKVLSRSSPMMLSLQHQTIIIETSTLSLSQKVALNNEVKLSGGILLDCPMSGTAHQAREADLVAYLSGDDSEAKMYATSILESFTRSVLDLGVFGNGTLTKLIANHLVAVHNVAAAEALSIANAAGMDLPTVLNAVSAGAGNSRMLEIRGPLMIGEDYIPAGMRVDLFLKDLGLISELTDELNVSSPLLDSAHQIYKIASGEGRDSQDTACAYSVMKTMRKQDRSVHGEV
jgi:L-threonate 2-dehydrogenase